MKRIALFAGFLLFWVSSQASEMISIQYQSVTPVSKALDVRFANARVGVYCVYRAHDEQDSLLVRQFAQSLRVFCLESPAISVMRGESFGLLPLSSDQELVPEQTLRDLAVSDSLDYVYLIDRYSIKTSQFLFLQYQVDYRLYSAAKDSVRSMVDIRRITWLQDENKDADMINAVADYFANVIMPYWDTQERTVYEGVGTEAKQALKAAQNFRWKDAVPIWMKLSNVANDQTAAEMYYNVAVGLEAMGEYDLALQWIKRSIAVMDLDDDQKVVRNQIQNKIKMQELINKQLK